MPNLVDRSYKFKYLYHNCTQDSSGGLLLERVGLYHLHSFFTDFTKLHYIHIMFHAGSEKKWNVEIVEIKIHLKPDLY